MLRLHDTATGSVRPLELREPGKVSIYVCGPTVYDVPHIGHGRSMLVYDVLRRYLTWTGLDVALVSNITDIDDNIINRAAEQGTTPEALAVEHEGTWYAASDALGVDRPTADPHATAYVAQMVEAIGELLARGSAYETPDGVYFSAPSVEGYGLLARQTLESMQAGARVEVVGEKRDPSDFVLWKPAKPGEPAWPSPWGEGRPGWHTECVVMSLDLLGDGFDLHAGGMDLAFPHHENERAQALALGRTFARHWMHHAFVEVGGEKMSKSLDNFTSLTDLLRKVDRRAYRLLVLRSHYRSPLEVTATTTADATAALRRLDTVVRRAAENGIVAGEPDPAVLERFRGHMDNDLNTPPAMGLLFEQVRLANTVLDTEDDASAAVALATVATLAQAVGLELGPTDGGPDAAAAAIAARRDDARSARDWAAADAARDELVALGYVVEDGPMGTRIRRS